ncbi:MAG TPA: serine/threonine-protein kinase [Candidatus Eisenbacteria bacterium]|nr:serine/threonine-protein kinase [Candidatus Eisenbacteria bacterium]
MSAPPERNQAPTPDPGAASRRFARVKEILVEVREIEPRDRPALLDRLCAGDGALRSEVESLLAVEGLDVPHLHPDVVRDAAREALAAGTGSPRSAEPPSRIGPYRIVGVLGEGGMGTVYLAEQESPIRREVALKLIRAGVDRSRIAARFEGERQALAMMNHPSIARILDAGQDEAGTPYFVMERVIGATIVEYCDARRLAVRARLALFLDVCGAVAHAHQRGVVHRDLKPSNVLVAEPDGRPTPKIIDFGIAKAVGEERIHDTLATQHGTLLGTPEYMSPEQAGAYGGAVDTRTDVYSLGALLFELLAGRRPHEFSGKPIHEIQRVLVEAPPARASEAARAPGAEEPAARRGTTPARLAQALRGDLDAILATALRPEPDRRYGTVEQLASDIRNHLESLPVLARRGAWRYRAGKFLVRHRAAAVASAVILVAIGGVVATLITQSVRVATQRDRAIEAEQRARREAATASQVADFLRTLFEQANPDESLGAEITVREMLDRGANRVREELRDQPVIQARLLVVMARAYHGLGRYREATEACSTAIALQRTRFAPDDPELATSLDLFGTILHDDGDLDPSESYYRAALDIRRAALGDSSAETAESMQHLAVTLQAKGELTEAEPYYRGALSTLRASHGDQHVEVAWAKNSLAWCVHQQGRYAEAESLYRQAYATQRRLLGGRHPDVAGTLNNLAGVRYHRGDDEEAGRLWSEALEIYQFLYPRGHVAVARAEYNVARVLLRTGDLRGAEALRRASLTRIRTLVDPDHPHVATHLLGLAEVLIAEGKTAEAEPLIARSLEIRRATYGTAHPSTAFSIEAMGDLRLEQSRPREAIRWFEEANAARASGQPAGHGDHALPLLGIARARLRLGDRAGADSAAAAALAIRRRAFEDPHPWIDEAVALRRETETRLAPSAMHRP